MQLLDIESGELEDVLVVKHYQTLLDTEDKHDGTKQIMLLSYLRGAHFMWNTVQQIFKKNMSAENEEDVMTDIKDYLESQEHKMIKQGQQLIKTHLADEDAPQ